MARTFHWVIAFNISTLPAVGATALRKEGRIAWVWDQTQMHLNQHCEGMVNLSEGGC
jgi:hypothetical protein